MHAFASGVQLTAYNSDHSPSTLAWNIRNSTSSLVALRRVIFSFISFSLWALNSTRSWWPEPTWWTTPLILYSEQPLWHHNQSVCLQQSLHSTTWSSPLAVSSIVHPQSHLYLAQPTTKPSVCLQTHLYSAQWNSTLHQHSHHTHQYVDNPICT